MVLIDLGITLLAMRRSRQAPYALVIFGVLVFPLGLPAIYAGYRRMTQ